MASVRENLIAAKALIDTPEKWGKGAYEHLGCYCAIGAVAAVMGITEGKVERDSREALALARAMPGKWSCADGEYVHRYNDDPFTTHADIMALFDRAIAAQVEA